MIILSSFASPYAPEGKVYEIEESMDPGSLPAAMKSAINKEYPKGKIVKVEKAIQDTSVTSEVQVKVGKKTRGLGFDASGNLLKANKESAEKEENEKDEKKEDD